MFRYENPQFFWYLLVIPVFILLFIIGVWWRNRNIKKLGGKETLSKLTPGLPIFKRYIKFGLLMLSVFFLVIALANPQFGTKTEKVKRQGVDVFIAIDVSKSMLAEDVKPSRLVKTKQMVSTLIDRLQNDRIGIIVFAGNAYLQVPLTIDYGATKLFMNSLNPEVIPTQGTAIGAAIELAMESHDEKNKKHQALVIISDGEDHDSEAEDMARKARDNGISVFTIGVGSDEGAPIPASKVSGSSIYKRDAQGKVIMSRLNEGMLKKIADKGGGKYYRMSKNNSEVRALVGQLAQIEKKEFEERIYTDYEDWFQIPLGIALLLLLVEFLLYERRSSLFGKLFGTK